MSTAARHSPVAIRRATLGDAALLATLGRSTFVDTFAPDNDPADMRAYVAEAFSEEMQLAELDDARLTVFFAECEGIAVGYAMLRDGVGADGAPTGDAIEIARLYAERRWIGAGIGAALMQRCLAEASARGRQTIWLGVWERNARAIAFYERWGFAVVGSHPFLLGTDMQTDCVMARRVVEDSKR